MKHILLIVALAAACSAASMYMTVTPDSHLVIVNAARDTLWKSSDVVQFDSALVAGSAYSLVGGTIDQTARDTSIYAKWVAIRDSLFCIRDSGYAFTALDTGKAAFRLAEKARDTARAALAGPDTVATRAWGNTIWLALAGKATDATKSDSALVSASTHALPDSNPTVTVLNATRGRFTDIFGALTGKSTTSGTADSSAGGATRATTAGNVQGKDTTGLWKHAGKDSAATGDYDSLVFVKGGGRTCVITGANAWAGGLSDTASGAQAVVAGGSANKASGDSSTVGGGRRNKATAAGATIAGGINNTASGANSTIAGGGGASSDANTASGVESYIGGGTANTASGLKGVVSGGGSNNNAGARSVIAGGGTNTIMNVGSYATIGGGYANIVAGIGATIPGGYANRDSADYSALLGDSLRCKKSDTFSFGFGAGAGHGRLVSPGKRCVWFGVDYINTVMWAGDSLVTQPGVDLIVYGPAKIDSLLTANWFIVGGGDTLGKMVGLDAGDTVMLFITRHGAHADTWKMRK